MINGLSVLALVPARSVSKGIPDKNMTCLGGQSLIARAGQVLSRIPWIDRRIISTDSAQYADEAIASGLEAPFLRPAELSTDHAGALETIIHALDACERRDACRYELVILAEPTSPLREPGDIEAAMKALLSSGADSAVTVSRIDTKAHPHKVFAIDQGRLRYFSAQGSRIAARQGLEPLYARNGLCYCFRRKTLVEKRALITDNTVSVITERPVVNIDEPLDLLWAEFLLDKVCNSVILSA
jgi:CMP-N,N'-diacetyllegionaminic acid synthase